MISIKIREAIQTKTINFKLIKVMIIISIFKILKMKMKHLKRYIKTIFKVIWVKIGFAKYKILNRYLLKMKLS